MTQRKLILLVSIVVLGLGFIMALIWWNFIAQRVNDLPVGVLRTSLVFNKEKISEEEIPLVTVLAKKLEIPWALDFLPDGSIIFTERAGRIRLIDSQAGLLEEPLLRIEEVASKGEGGLLGIAVHPDFAENQFIYVYYTYQEGENLANQVVRFRKQDKILVDKEIIIKNIPGAANHNGGRIFLF